MKTKKLRISKILCSLFSAVALLLCSIVPPNTQTAQASAPLIILSCYRSTLNIGQELQLVAVTSDWSFPSFSSSASAIASVDAYGKIKAKKAGTCKIKAKSGKSEAYCEITVRKTTITLNSSSVSLEKNETFSLKATTSNGSTPVFRCNKKSVALVEETGKITAIKPGEAVITVKADQTEVYCRITVKKPTITLNKTTATLYRNQSVALSAKISNSTSPVWSSSAKKVATVSEKGVVTAQKHGKATITVKADGVSKKCTVTVKSPKITLSAKNVTLSPGKKKTITATVSSGNTPVWSSSKSAVASVNQKGVITAHKKGTATIKAKEDGTIVSCKVKVTN
ncbi:MAG: Ig-like domain-containing protein [Lachnospiraceae bacterium]|nr:Ig-like domain-containing protein [Lachnospiraceae bacterium]